MGRGKNGRARPGVPPNLRPQGGPHAPGLHGRPNNGTMPPTDGSSAAPSAATGAKYESCYITLTLAEVATLIDAGMNLERLATFHNGISVDDMYKSVQQSITHVLDDGRRPPMMNKATAVFVEQILAYRCKKKVIQPSLFVGFDGDLCPGPGGKCVCAHCGEDEEHEDEDGGGPGNDGNSGGKCKHTPGTAPPSGSQGTPDTTSSSKEKSNSSATQRTAQGPMNKDIASQILGFGDGLSSAIPKKTGPIPPAAETGKATIAATVAEGLPSLMPAPGQAPIVNKPSVVAARPRKVDVRTIEASKPEQCTSARDGNKVASTGPKNPQSTSWISRDVVGVTASNVASAITAAASEMFRKERSQRSGSDPSSVSAISKGLPPFSGGGTSITPPSSAQLLTSVKRSRSTTRRMPGPSGDAIQLSEPKFSLFTVPHSSLSDQLQAEVAAVNDWVDKISDGLDPAIEEIEAAVDRVRKIFADPDMPPHIKAVFSKLSVFLESKDEGTAIMAIFYAFETLISGKWSTSPDLSSTSKRSTSSAESSYPLPVLSTSQTDTSVPPPSSPAPQQSRLEQPNIHPDNIHVGNAPEAVRKLVAEVELGKKTDDMANAPDEGVESSLADLRTWTKGYNERMKAIEEAGESGVTIAASNSTVAVGTEAADDDEKGEVDNEEGKERMGSLTKEWLETCQWATTTLKGVDAGFELNHRKVTEMADT